MTVTDMDIEYNLSCESDVLIVGEGPENDVIHRYCNRERRFGNESEVELLKERFKVIKSRSRYLTLTWKTDDTEEHRGWRIDYEFIPEGAECGFSTHAMSGVVHSPKWPEDYGNDEECIWDIQVPLGYHVHLQFTHFDIAPSEDCAKDSLTVISQEHSSRAEAPIGDYFFLFEDEEAHAPLCGITLPKSFRSESNRIRLNFTSDESTTAAGFRAEWKAECGAVFRLTRGVISSPNYPDHYPNVNQRCDYMIAAENEPNAVIALKLLDFDLSDSKMDYSRSPCASDYLEVRDVNNNRVVMTYCGGDPMDEEPIAIKRDNLIPPLETYLGEKSGCGGTLKATGDWKTLEPPLDDKGEYIHNLHCGWNIIGPEKTMLEIHITKLDTENLSAPPGVTDALGSRCVDVLTIYDGYKSFSPILASDLCEDTVGAKLPLVYHTSHR
ncbi:CUB domain protein [Oesophagostomum dentatum]|uniref:CUB domain protein n=1 Tax=Oesophagostomum dentatum TaxID=61180 RepID=A0A0B1ST84_OESDE|nr:CUB domain protein [Oesophagostomum dentatum]